MIIWSYYILYYIILYHVLSCYIMLYHAISYYIILYHVISCYIILYHIVLSIYIYIQLLDTTCTICVYNASRGPRRAGVELLPPDLLPSWGHWMFRKSHVFFRYPKKWLSTGKLRNKIEILGYIYIYIYLFIHMCMCVYIYVCVCIIVYWYDIIRI